jgi:hypothetical protein
MLLVLLLPSTVLLLPLLLMLLVLLLVVPLLPLLLLLATLAAHSWVILRGADSLLLLLLVILLLVLLWLMSQQLPQHCPNKCCWTKVCPACEILHTPTDDATEAAARIRGQAAQGRKASPDNTISKPHIIYLLFLLLCV